MGMHTLVRPRYHTSLMKRLCVLLSLVIWLLPLQAAGQELACDVGVDYSQLSGVDYSYLDGLGRKIEAYMNERSWTDDDFLPFERIDCQMELIFTQASGQKDYTAQLAISMRRPIYGTTQRTTIVRFSDQSWQFSHTRGAPLRHQPQGYDPLTSVLDFYANMMLGYDYDTFSRLGGTPYFERARRIAEQAESLGGASWSNTDGSGRADLAAQLLQTRLEPLRLAYYRYHFRGLDRFVTHTSEARTAVLETLRNLQALRSDLTRRYPLDLFFSAKYQELIAIFEGSSLSGDAYDLLTAVDPSHFSTYQELVSY